MRVGTISVREALGDDVPGITDKDIQDALWHYFYDVEKSVNYLIQSRTAKKKPAKKKAKGGSRGKPSDIGKNKRRARMVKQFSGKRAKLKAVTKDQSVTMEERFSAQLKLAALPRNSSPGRVRNRCEFSGRARGFYRKVKLSRIALRELGNLGQIPGLVKSSW